LSIHFILLINFQELPKITKRTKDIVTQPGKLLRIEFDVAGVPEPTLKW
jgi:hypothetical protein